MNNRTPTLAGLLVAMGCGQFAVTDAPVEPQRQALATTRQAVAGENEPVDCDDPSKPETLEEYAKKCQTAMDGIEVPKFDCDDDANSVEVPDTNGDGLPWPDETCDRPNVLRGQCDRGSRFQVLTNKGDIRAVAHCRKMGDSKGFFNDIAVIQYNQRTGDTCFYQSVIGAHTPGAVPSPLYGQQGVWQDPHSVAGIGCIGCHDNGPFIRTPYLAQNANFPEAVTKGAVLPGSTDYSWNSTQPYRFVGTSFQGWKTYRVAVSNTNVPNSTQNQCTTCHRMAMSSNGTSAGHPLYQTFGGTTFLFGGIATAKTQAKKNPHSTKSPIWMLPDNMAPNASLWAQQTETEAALVKACGQSIVDGKPLDGCNLVRFGQGDTCRGAPVIGTINGGTKGTPTTTKHETIVPMGSGPGNPGFCYWKAVHGPFFQSSAAGLKFSDPNFFGSFLKIEVDAQGYFVAHSAVSPLPNTSKAEPGGTFECTGFNELADVSDVSTCWDSFNSIADDKGNVPYTEKKIADSNTDGSALTGFVGSLSQFNEGQNDRVRVEENSGVTLLTQRHLTSSGMGLKPGPSSAEAWSFGCKTWTPKWVARHVYTDTDVLLLPAALAPKSRCFITGITGAWSSTRNNETVQPFAEIYTAVNGDIRFRAAPAATGNPPDRVGAFASCVQIKP